MEEEEEEEESRRSRSTPLLTESAKHSDSALPVSPPHEDGEAHTLTLYSGALDSFLSLNFLEAK